MGVYPLVHPEMHQQCAKYFQKWVVILKRNSLKHNIFPTVSEEDNK